LKQIAAQRGVPINSLRLKVVIERLLARLVTERNPLWLLKGGYAMELRFRPRARTTKDIDLAAKTLAAELSTQLRRIRDELQTAADQDLGISSSFVSADPAPNSRERLRAAHDFP
jgi:hypothetical protein